MKLTRFRGMICWTVGLLALASVAHAQKSRVFHGEVSDSQCALNVHSLTRSHREMLKSKSMGGTSRNCTLYCIQYLGGDFALSSKNDVFRLDDQDKAKAFAGMKVKITGSMDPKTKLVHVESIESEP